MATWQILIGDCIEQMAMLPAGSARCCVTSPPYWGLRDYGVDGQLGLEATPEAFVEKMVAVFAEVRRALADDGTLWLNVGDSYASSPPGNTTKGVSGKSTLHGVNDQNGRYRETLEAGHATKRNTVVAGLKPKDLVGIPWMLAFALRADGWYLRSDIIWAKPNPMPESVTDRPTKSHEYIFLLSKSGRYYYDADAIAEPSAGTGGGASFGKQNHDAAGTGAQSRTYDRPDYATRNARSVWTITTQPYPEAHFATFPLELPLRCVRAGSATGDTVLDPFCGSGTTGEAAVGLERNFVGCELNPEYARMARDRIGRATKPNSYRSDRMTDAPLFAGGLSGGACG